MRMARYTTHSPYDCNETANGEPEGHLRCHSHLPPQRVHRILPNLSPGQASVAVITLLLLPTVYKVARLPLASLCGTSALAAASAVVAEHWEQQEYTLLSGRSKAAAAAAAAGRRANELPLH